MQQGAATHFNRPSAHHAIIARRRIRRNYKDGASGVKENFDKSNMLHTPDLEVAERIVARVCLETIRAGTAMIAYFQN